MRCRCFSEIGRRRFFSIVKRLENKEIGHEKTRLKEDLLKIKEACATKSIVTCI